MQRSSCPARGPSVPTRASSTVATLLLSSFGLTGQSRQHIAVTGIVATATDDDGSLRVWPGLHQAAVGIGTGTRHQRVSGNAFPIDCAAVKTAHGSDRIHVYR